MISSSNFAVRAALAAGILLIIGACKGAGPKNYLHSEWSEFTAANPTDIVVLRVQGVSLPAEVHLEDVREAAQTELRNHRYSTLDANFVDAGYPARLAATNAGVKTTHGESVAPAFGAVSQLQIVIKEFDHLRYDVARVMHVVGEFQFHDESGKRLLATVNSDQMVDLSDEAQRGVGRTDAIREAARRFVQITLRSMPERTVVGSSAK